MNMAHYGMLAAYVIALFGLAYPLGLFMARIASTEQKMPLLVERFEKRFFGILGIDYQREMSWVRYAVALLVFNAIGVFVVYEMQRLQAHLPLNPASVPAVGPDLSFDTAVSFVTNTDWQAYSGESTMSYLVQMLALTVQNFVCAATGIAVAFALIRGFARRSSATIGNFWVDLTRSTLYLLLPISIVLSLVFSQQGVIQNLDAYKNATTLEVTNYDNPKLGPDSL